MKADEKAEILTRLLDPDGEEGFWYLPLASGLTGIGRHIWVSQIDHIRALLVWPEGQSVKELSDRIQVIGLDEVPDDPRLAAWMQLNAQVLADSCSGEADMFDVYKQIIPIDG